MTRTLQILGLVLLLPVGGFLALLGHSMFISRYDNRGTGVFYGHVGGHCYGDHFILFEFQGESKPAWRWARPENYTYQTLNLVWDSGSKQGQGVLDLSTFELTTKDQSFKLTEDVLAELLQRDTLRSEQVPEDQIKFMFSLLVAAGNGTLPPPRHHGHSFEEPVDCQLTHFSLGSRIPYIMYVWGIIWISIVTVAIIRATRKNRA